MGQATKDDLAPLIESYELELPCAHCASINRRPLGWVRAHREMNCCACHELIVLDTSRVRDLIRDTTRQLRSLNDSLHANLDRWSGTEAAEPPPRDTARQRSTADPEQMQRLLHALRAAEELLLQAEPEDRAVERRLFLEAASALHEKTKRLLGNATATAELASAIEALARKLSAVRRRLGATADRSDRATPRSSSRSGNPSRR